MYSFNKLKGDINLKWFFLIYFVFLLSFTLYQTRISYFNIKLTLIPFLALFLIGCLILFISNKDVPLYKVAFIIILIFGLISVFLTPIVTVCDETEHFWRSELTSNGELFPSYVDIPNSNKTSYESKGYLTIASMSPLYKITGDTIYNSSWANEKINYSSAYVSSAFCQNPFYGYIPQAIGINIAKGLNLNNIWMLWFGRIFNLLMFSLIASYAIKKAPIFKIPLLICSCMALTIYQAASLSIDSSVNALAILSIGYFLYMYKAKEKTLSYKNIGIFLIISLLCGFTKVTYMGLALLIFLVPKNNFKTEKVRYSRIIGFLSILIIDLLWTKLFATKQLLNSWRGTYFLKNNVNALSQLVFMWHHPIQSFNIIFNIENVWNVISGFFSFGNLPPYTSTFLVISFLIFYVAICFLYPSEIKINRKFRIGIFLIGFLIFFGTYFVQYLTWCNVGYPKVVGVFGRYFIPLIALGPMIFNINMNKKISKNLNLLVICFVICFISSMLLLTFINFY
ncbi:hypothetical protein BGI41_00420 [Methanobrevibacter sp. 87.7]|uniref:DUF2142 domain-containing protein n=1 Tax=Methanobrevibacter sp. 87.7 TaxID=387957 RepID=UPI000B50B9C4|nr:DUF2142 domain-containing protein [Methanobrevibacter sp. 87.7]OWT33814.1 hypothetical protein BGI41_00420 [Methanobrevibacter sp. 87.7]